jgi:DNA-directed RNA polymerase subunit RPC12/RpoP
MADAYKCLECRKEFDIEKRVRCPYCGFRVVAKARPAFKKRVRSR